MNRTIEQWQNIDPYAFALRALGKVGDVRDLVDQAINDLEELNMQRDELLSALKGVTLTQEDIDMGRTAGDEQHAAARAVIAAVEGGGA